MPFVHHPLFLLPTRQTRVLLLVALFITKACIMAMCATEPSDLAVLQAFLKSVTNPSKLSSWVGDPCADNWPYIICKGSRVTELQLQNVGLEGSLPSNFNQLSSLEQIGLQGNSLSGPLPSFSGLTLLTMAYLGDQQFSSIPLDFFKDLSSLLIFTLQNNPINSSLGWSLPSDMAVAVGLTTLVLTNTSLNGAIPDFLGMLTNLQELHISYNKFTGGIPASFSMLTQLSRFELNNNVPLLSGSIDVVGSMASLNVLWLQVNNFSGTIPSSLGALVSLQECRLNDNNLVGTIPTTFISSSLQVLFVKGNSLVGPIPYIRSISNPSNYDYSENKFCQSEVGVACDPEVSALISFLEDVNYPLSLIGSWNGNSSCTLLGITCNAMGKVNGINLPSARLSGSISSYLGNLTFLTKLVLSGNNFTGTIPDSLTKLKSLVLVDVRNNNLYSPIPAFNTSQVTLFITGNININISVPPPSTNSPQSAPSPSTNLPESGPWGTMTSMLTPQTSLVTPITPLVGKSFSLRVGTITGAVVGVLFILICAIIGLVVYKKKGQKFGKVQLLKSVTNSYGEENVIFSIQFLQSVTNNFSEENVLGRGGFGVVYKGELVDGTKIAVKRMIASMVKKKGLEEFQAEIAVLTKVRHRHLVALLGYCIEGNERLLVYEYMARGTLSQHLFEGREPLSWEKRLSIALDVARGMEYLHGLAHESFIHRDLKPSNILLGDDYRAKVSDFGLVKLAPNGGNFSLQTRLAGTFGYLAPEYTATGRVSTKADVFSFGVVLMELLTGQKAVDKSKPEDSMYLVTWFQEHIENNHSILNLVDSTLKINDETSQSISIVVELSRHCTIQEPHNRPAMGHVVNVLAPLVEQWKPMDVVEDDENVVLRCQVLDELTLMTWPR